MSITPETKLEIVELASQAYECRDFFNDVEFKKDVYNIFIIKKMISRFLRTGNINEKLVLNNIIISLNIFGIERANLIYSKAMRPDEFAVMKAFLLFLDAYQFEDEIEPNDIIVRVLLDTAQRYKIGYRQHV